ncbi:MAG: hypothetical protein ACOC9A_02275 [Candidatus Bipolaricaulota bacterium]
MFNKKRTLKVAAWLVAFALVIVALPSTAEVGVPEEDRAAVLQVINEKFGSLPNVEYEFGQPSASHEGIEVTSNRNLAISEANLSDGLVLGLVKYEEEAHLFLASALPEEIEEGYATGVIDLTKEETVFVAYANLESQDGSGEGLEINVNESNEDSDLLEFEIVDKKYSLTTLIPKSLQE